MAGNHLREPLDYLYEELPPAKMTEVRQHLSQCPECRAQMRAIRETVKLYRKAEHPIPPVGLSAATIRNALKIARSQERARTVFDEPVAEKQPDETIAKADVSSLTPSCPSLPTAVFMSVPAAPLPDTRQQIHRRVEYSDAEFSRLKEEVLGELRGNSGWRTWLFHPAWTVAASVIFLCALLVHFSPRMYRQETERFVAAPVRDDTSLMLRDRERLPAASHRQVPRRETQAAAPEGSPILHEAALMNQSPAFFPSGEFLPEIPAGQVDTGSGIRPSGVKPGSVSPAFNPPARRSKSVRPKAFSSSPDGLLRGVPFPAPIGKRHNAGDDIEKAAEITETEGESSGGSSKPFAASSSHQGRPVTEEGAESLEKKEAPEKDTTAKTTEQQTEQVDSGVKQDVAVMLLDGFSPDTIPQLIERPTPIDVTERIRSLSALIGMQIASGEIHDAIQSLAILERYDPKAAAEMRKLLPSITGTGEEPKPKARIGSPLPADAPVPKDKPVPIVEAVPSSSPSWRVRPPLMPGGVREVKNSSAPQASSGACTTEDDKPTETTGAEVLSKGSSFNEDVVEPLVEQPSLVFSQLPELSLPEPESAQPIQVQPLQTASEVVDISEEAARSTVFDNDENTDTAELSRYGDVMEVETIVPVFSETDASVATSVPLKSQVEVIDIEKYFPLSIEESVDRSDTQEKKTEFPPHLDSEPQQPSVNNPSALEHENRRVGSVQPPGKVITVPKVMEPAAPLDGFVSVRTGQTQATWVTAAIDSPPEATVEVEKSVPSERKREPVSEERFSSSTLPPGQQQTQVFVHPSPPSLPVQTVIVLPAIPVSAPVSIEPPRHRVQAPQPYLRDL